LAPSSARKMMGPTQHASSLAVIILLRLAAAILCHTPQQNSKSGRCEGGSCESKARSSAVRDASSCAAEQGGGGREGERREKEVAGGERKEKRWAGNGAYEAL
jgi:hypothetical protein